MQLHVNRFQCITTAKKAIPPAKLRGYLGGAFYDHPLIHNHENGKSRNRYPLIQYKILDDIPTIVSVKDGNAVIQKLFTEINEIQLINKTYPVLEKNLKQTKYDYGGSEQFYQYEFLTPWIPFNQKNYEQYKTLETNKQRADKLKSILIGNILSQAKGLDYWIEQQLEVKLALHQTDRPVEYKKVQFIGFEGYFKVNFNLPDYLGIGKAVSHGFGTIKRMET
ncbi:MAG: DNA repair protein [Candidatus Marinimicrobia bacterium]|nr:DNA repair protein [Candidatus Neomarinimicrobiota bacterium]MCF7828062.1 DNA repair protein [Candidatus Neomarinimicrobiota bacterium]MCF7879183.1 DNA repair protein [Candidatus Neomarinimicrobiota bacterium]